MNKKGYTLIELLTTITLLGLIATMASINTIKLFDEKKEQEEKTLWIDKTEGKPKKLEIKRANKNTKIYILYNEVNLNSLK